MNTQAECTIMLVSASGATINTVLSTQTEVDTQQKSSYLISTHTVLQSFILTIASGKEIEVQTTTL
jgi:hypothetical protein